MTITFLPLGQTHRAWIGMGAALNGDIYASNNSGDIYKQSGGTGDFLPLGQTARLWRGLTVALNGDVYAACWSGDIYKQSKGIGNFLPLSQTSRAWWGMATSPNGDVYAVDFGRDIYKQSGGVGNFLPLSQTHRNWTALAAAPNGDIYAVEFSGDIYKQYGGVGNFLPLSQTSRNWYGMTASPNGDVYAVVLGGDIYIQFGGIGNFQPTGQASLNWAEITASPDGIIYAGGNLIDIYEYTPAASLKKFIDLAASSDNHAGTSADPYSIVDWQSYISVNTGTNVNFYVKGSGISVDAIRLCYDSSTNSPMIRYYPWNSYLYGPWRLKAASIILGRQSAIYNAIIQSDSSIVGDASSNIMKINSSYVIADDVTAWLNCRGSLFDVRKIEYDSSHKSNFMDCGLSVSEYAGNIILSNCVSTSDSTAITNINSQLDWDASALPNFSSIQKDFRASVIYDGVATPPEPGIGSPTYTDYSSGLWGEARTGIGGGYFLDIYSPSFTVQPVSLSKAVRDTATFSVVTIGLPAPTFQWYFNGTALSDIAGVSGSMTETLTINNLSKADEGTYQVVATNGLPSDATSDSANLSVSPENFGNGHGFRQIALTDALSKRFRRLFGQNYDYVG